MSLPKSILNRIDWLSLYAVAGSILIFCILALLSADGWSEYAPAAMAISLVLATRMFWAPGRRASMAGLFVIHLLAAWLLLANFLPVRDALRWGLWSRRYKSALAAQRSPPIGEFGHVEWDGWGFPGAGNTTVYLVFDPKDSLAVAAQGNYPDGFLGLPADAARVRRLEKFWYAVTFFTDTTWEVDP